MEKIRVVQIIAPIDNYGKERWLLAFLKHLDRERFETNVLILSPSTESPLCGNLDNIGIESRILSGSGKFSRSDIRDMRAYLTGNDTDIIHTHDYKSDIFGYFASAGSGIRKVGTPHGWCGTGDTKVAFYEQLDRFFLGLFDTVAPLSVKMAGTLRFAGKGKVTVINNFIDLDRIPKPEEGDPRLITYMGRLVGLKRVEDAIRAVALVDDAGVRMQIIGDGPKRKELEDLAGKLGLSGRIDFLGHRRDSLELLNRSRILVLPSLTEGISRSIMEAMALKRVIIATDVPGINELITDGENGFLVRPEDPAALAKKIRLVLADEKGSTIASEKARITVENEFSASKVVRDYERLYSKLAG